jgi:hypothetical protein
MKSSYRLGVVSVLIGVSAMTVVAASSARAQQLTLSFRFDDGTANPALDYAALATNKTITPANSGQTYTIDIFATVTGTGGTVQNRLGLQSIEYRGLLSSVNNNAFSTGSGTGQTGTVSTQYTDAGGANPPYALGGSGPWAFFNSANTVNGTGWPGSSSGTIGDFGTTSNGTDIVAATSGVIGFGGRSQASSTTELAFESDGANYLNNVMTPDVTGINVAGPNSTTFDLAQFQFKIGAVSSIVGAKTTFLPTLPLLSQTQSLIATYKITASTAINATGQSPYSIDTSGVSWTVVNTPEPSSEVLLLAGAALVFGVTIRRFATVRKGTTKNRIA